MAICQCYIYAILCSVQGDVAGICGHVIWNIHPYLPTDGPYIISDLVIFPILVPVALR